jgi:hypothetical protein
LRRDVAALALVAGVSLLGRASVGAEAPHRVFVPVTVHQEALQAPPETPAAGTPTATATPTPTVTATATVTPTATPAPADLYIASQAGRCTSGDDYHRIYVQAVNRGGSPAYRPRVTVRYERFFGPGSPATYTSDVDVPLHLALVRPGEAATGDVAAVSCVEVSSYEVLAPTWSASPGFPVIVRDGIEVQLIGTHRSGTDVLVDGRITNNTGQTVDVPSVDIGIYGPDGTILAAAYDAPFPNAPHPPPPPPYAPAAPGASAAFSHAFPDPDARIPAVYTVTLAGQAQVYPTATPTG